VAVALDRGELPARLGGGGLRDAADDGVRVERGARLGGQGVEEDVCAVARERELAEAADGRMEAGRARGLGLGRG
jgi:hypothetical protein